MEQNQRKLEESTHLAEQLNNLKWSPQLESIEDYVQKINQLATALGTQNQIKF